MSTSPLIYQYVSSAKAPTFTWRHYDASGNDVLQLLTDNHTDLPQEVITALLAEDTRPRYSTFETGFLLNLRGLNLNTDATSSGPEDMVSIRIWCDRKNLISTRRRNLKAVNDLRDALDEGYIPESAADILAQLIENLMNRMAPTLEEMDRKIDRFETEDIDKLHGESLKHLSSDVTVLARQAAKIRRYIIPQQRALADFISGEQALLSSDHQMRLRETQNRFSLFLENLESMRERASLIREELDYQNTMNMNQHTNLLSIVAAIFLPLGFVTGLLGMNIAGMPGMENPNAFWIVSAALAATVVGLLGFFYSKKWF